MSAILFNGEQTTVAHQQQQQQLINSNNNYTDHTNTNSNDNNVDNVFSTHLICHGDGNNSSVDMDDTDVLAQQMAALEMTGMQPRSTSRQQSNCDGSDSGVDIAISNVQRDLMSQHSGGSANGSGVGISQSGNETTHEQNMSCNSSLISCGSDLYEAKSLQCHSSSNSSQKQQHVARHSYEYCSDNGSESSSVQGVITAKSMNYVGVMNAAASATRRSSNVKKKVAMFEPILKDTKEKEAASKVTPQTSSRPRAGSQLQRAVSLPRSTQPSSLRLPRERAQEKQLMSIPAGSIGKHSLSSTPTRQVGMTQSPMNPPLNTPSSAMKPQKPDSLPTPLNRKHSMSMQRLVQRTPSLSRARTPGTPSDDGRWPAVTQQQHQQRSTVSRRGMSVTPDMSSMKMRTSMLSTTIEQKSTGTPSQQQTAANPYGTLPRRRKQQSVEDLSSVRGSRSSSISRESRMTSSVVLPRGKNLLNSYGSTSLAGVKSTGASRRTPPQPKTRIYHETSVQTALTQEDIERALAGSLSVMPPIDLVEKHDQQTQSDIRDRELERLQEEVRQLKQREQELTAKLQRERDEKLGMQRELTLNTERVCGMLEMARIIGGSAGTPSSDDGESHDSLLMLESQIQLSGHELSERHKEISQLRKLCMSLQFEMERSLAAQKNLIEEKAAIEQESNEMQDFLQHEKAAMCDALKELETEYQNCKQLLSNRDEEVKVLRDECRHLVRLNEQRRQENRMLQTKYSALEAKSKELILQQNASVAGASSALSGLHTRLDDLVEQLVFSYNISENDLEDTGFQSADCTGNLSSDLNGCDSQTVTTTTAAATHRTNATPNTLDLSSNGVAVNQQPQLLSDGSLSPQRNQSFIAAVISAIRHATTAHGGKRLSKGNVLAGAGKRHTHHAQQQQQQQNNNNSHVNSHNNNSAQHQDEQQQQRDTLNGDDSDSTEMLDSETEPCLMMDNVLEDVIHPDSHSHNMVSSCMGLISQIDLPNDLSNYATANVDTSLHNLSQAITNRQQLELEMNAQKCNANNHIGELSVSEDQTSCHDSLAEMPSLIEYSTTQAVVDQVIEVDTLITKLLKVLRLIQLDNDNCIQQLIVDKNKLQQHKEDMLEKLKELQDCNMKLQDELMDATQELMLKNSDLSSTKAEMQRHRNEIDRLTEDVCTLSTLCSNYKKLSPLTEFPPMLSAQNGADGTTATSNDDIRGIINLLKLWHNEGQLQDQRIKQFLQKLLRQLSLDEQQLMKNYNSNNNNNNNDCINAIIPTPVQHNERLLIYANQLENILLTLQTHKELEDLYPAIKEMRLNVETVKLNANWLDFLRSERATEKTATTIAEIEADTTIASRETVNERTNDDTENANIANAN